MEKLNKITHIMYVDVLVEILNQLQNQIYKMVRQFRVDVIRKNNSLKWR